MSIAPVSASRATTPTPPPATAAALPAGPDYFPTPAATTPTAPTPPRHPAISQALEQLGAGLRNGTLQPADDSVNTAIVNTQLGTVQLVSKTDLATALAMQPPVGMTDLLTGLADIATNAKPTRNWGQDRMHDAIPWPIPATPKPPVDPIIQPTPKYV